MEEACQSCRSWVDDIYWTHFQFIHFAQFLPSGYDQQLALPRRFSDNLKKKLPENVALRGPGGTVWNIGLTIRDEVIYFANGWQQFVKDHRLEENDLLVFKYNGESLFDVLIFDRGSFCEKAASYFVRKCGHTEHGSEYLNKRKNIDNSLEKVNTPSNAAVECVSPEKSMDDTVRVPAVVPSQSASKKITDAAVDCVSPEKSMDGNSVRVPTVVPSQSTSKKITDAGVESSFHEKPADGVGVTVPAVVTSRTTSKRIQKLVSAVQHVQTKRRGRPKGSRAHGGGVNWVPVLDVEPSSVGGSGAYELYTSNRRPVTKNEINNALELAHAACTDDSICIVMRPTHVYKRFYVSLSAKWTSEHLSPQTQDLLLRMGKDEWPARYSFDHGRRTGGLTGGWKHFALDNNLEEFDVCVFKPAGQKNDILILDVNIFRVVEEVTAHGKVNFAGRQGKKKISGAIQT